jgi:DNA-binding MarR family transcriptional regulator
MAKSLTRKINSSRQEPARAGPPGPPSPVDVLGRELSTAVVLFHEAVASRLGLSAAEWKCLGLLDQHGASTAGRIAELSGFTTGGITGIVDRLERAGYVRREANPHDRRSIVICPVENRALREQITPIFASLGQAMAAVAGRYSVRELKVIQDYFERTIQTLRDETAKVSRSGGSKPAADERGERG